jgi:hypothetical protein
MKTQLILAKTISGVLVLFLAILFTSCSKSAVTAEEKAKERAFAEQYNQWIDDHPEVINDLRTRALADDMTKEELSREAIGLMVRFSNEANLDIPQRMIDAAKEGEGLPSKKRGHEMLWWILYVVATITLLLHWRTQNAVWGTATFGFVIGVIIALCGGGWWAVAKSVAIGATLGTMTEWIPRLIKKPRY